MTSLNTLQDPIKKSRLQLVGTQIPRSEENMLEAKKLK